MRLLFMLLAVTSLPALAQPVVGVGDAAEQSAATPTPVATPPAPNETTVVEGRWKEGALGGSYNQPGWTERRRFPETRVYVAPAGTATFEVWAEPKVSLVGNDVRLRTMYEASFGLGHHLQLDLYLRLESNGTSAVELESERIELRWALADWGVLWGNPTLYLEWIRYTSAPQRLELKLLLGGQFTDRLYWGANLFWERELWGGPQEAEYGVTLGLSYSLLDSKFSLGAEARLELVDHRDTRFNPDSLELLVGPSITWRPVPNAHLLLVAFIGPELGRDAPGRPLTGGTNFQPEVVLGWRF
jgi:hypothetical protein